MLKDRLHKRRKELKLSREALAEKAGVSTSTITFLENGRNESSKHLVEIASALGVSAEWLKDGVENTNNSLPIGNIDNGSLAKRIDEKLKELHKSQEELANEVGVSQAAISKIILGETRNPKYLDKIAKALSVSEQWLLFGTAGASNAQIISTQAYGWDNGTPLPDDMAKIPFFCDMSLSAGHGSINDGLPYNGAVLWYSKAFLKRKNTTADKVFCIKVKGDSMEPVFDEGGIVMIDTLNTDIVDGKPYAITYDGDDYIKFIRRVPGVGYRIISANPSYEPFDAPLDAIKIIGRVIEYKKEW